MAYFELWLSINFLLGETDVYRWDWNYRKKNCGVSQHLLHFLGDKTAKKKQTPANSVDINIKLITDDPENNIRNWLSDP